MNDDVYLYMCRDDVMWCCNGCNCILRNHIKNKDGSIEPPTDIEDQIKVTCEQTVDMMLDARGLTEELFKTVVDKLSAIEVGMAEDREKKNRPTMRRLLQSHMQEQSERALTVS
jgi:hypothetical protein